MSGGWNTVDSDAGVFTRLIEKLGVKNVQLDDLYAIDAVSLREIGTIHGVIFLFKYGKVDRQCAQDGNKPLTGEYDTDYLDNGIFFANQTIQNACATQAVLNVLLNKTDDVEVGAELANFKAFVEGFDAEMAGDTISNSDLIRSVHNAFSSPSLIVDEDSKPPPDHDDTNDGLFHFVGYIMKNGYIYELDGLKRYPIRHQPCASAEDFYTKLPEVLRERIAKYKDELRFSLLVITNDKLRYYQEIGDTFAATQELNKRQVWDKEIELRKHDYNNLIFRLIKNIASDLSDDEWETLLQKGRDKSKQYYGLK